MSPNQSERRRMTIYVSAAEYKRLRHMAVDHNTTLQALVENAISCLLVDSQQVGIRVGFHLDPATYQRLRTTLSTHRVAVSDLMRRALDAHLDTLDKDPPTARPAKVRSRNSPPTHQEIANDIFTFLRDSDGPISLGELRRRMSRGRPWLRHNSDLALPLRVLVDREWVEIDQPERHTRGRKPSPIITVTAAGARVPAHRTDALAATE